MGKLGENQISLRDTEGIVCPFCGCQVFEQGIALRKVSSVLAGTDKDGLVPVTLFHCVNCHYVPTEFIPEELKSVDINGWQRLFEEPVFEEPEAVEDCSCDECCDCCEEDKVADDEE